MSMRCCVCSEVAKTEEDLRVHITVRHVRYIPLECYYCEHVFLPTLRSLTKHYGEAHRNKLPVAVATLSYDAEKATEVEKLVAQSQSSTDDIKSAAERTPKRKQQKEKRLEKRLKLPTNTKESVKTQEDGCSSGDAKIGESRQTNVEEPKKDKGKEQNQPDFWFDKENETITGRTEDDHSNSMIESETENEMSSLMEREQDISNQEDAEKAKGHPYASTLESEAEENGTTDDEVVDQQLNQKLYTDEESDKAEEQPKKRLNQDDGLAKRQNTTEIELSDNESEKDNSIFAFAPGEENDHDAAASPRFTSTSPQASPPVLSQLFQEETAVISAKGRRGRKPNISKDCALCGKKSFKKSDKREYHVWSKHMPMNRYGCLVCPLVRTSRLEAIRLHSSRFHAGDMSIVDDAKVQALDLYNATRQKAFPGLTPNSVKPITSMSLKSATEEEEGKDDGGRRTDANRTSTPAPVLTAEDIGEIASASPPAPVQAAENVSPLDSAGDPVPSPTPTNQPLSTFRRRSGPKGISKDCALCGKTSIRKSEQRECHIWSEHMRMYRFSCRLCPLIKTNRVAAIQSHVGRYHPGEMDVIEDARPKLEEQYNAIRLKAFPPLAPTITAPFQIPVDKSAIKCQLCRKMVLTKGQHIWGHHVQTRRFECSICGYTGAHTGMIKAHMFTKHPENIDAYVDRSQELHDEYKQNTLLAFGYAAAPETPRSSTPVQQGTPAFGRKRAASKVSDGKVSCQTSAVKNRRKVELEEINSKWLMSDPTAIE